MIKRDGASWGDESQQSAATGKGVRRSSARARVDRNSHRHGDAHRRFRLARRVAAGCGWSRPTAAIRPFSRPQGALRAISHSLGRAPLFHALGLWLLGFPVSVAANRPADNEYLGAVEEAGGAATALEGGRLRPALQQANVFGGCPFGWLSRGDLRAERLPTNLPRCVGRMALSFPQRLTASHVWPRPLVS
jgi:hypothetical protein